MLTMKRKTLKHLLLPKQHANKVKMAMKNGTAQMTHCRNAMIMIPSNA